MQMLLYGNLHESTDPKLGEEDTCCEDGDFVVSDSPLRGVLWSPKAWFPFYPTWFIEHHFQMQKKNFCTEGQPFHTISKQNSNRFGLDVLHSGCSAFAGIRAVERAIWLVLEGWLCVGCVLNKAFLSLRIRVTKTQNPGISRYR